jgi:hypothetical protein
VDTGETIFDVVRRFSLMLANGRTLRSIHDHMKTEVDELDVEITAVDAGEPEGEDGVIGESLDIIACALDAIVVARPDITEAELAAWIERKCTKWVANYSSGPSSTPAP